MIMDRIALILTIIGALNWGSIGLFQFDVVAWICGGSSSLLSRIIYTVVALAGIWCISLIFRNYGIATEIIAASIRGPQDVVDAAKCGAHIATVPYKVLHQMVKHPLTDAGIERFLADWASVPSANQ